MDNSSTSKLTELSEFDLKLNYRNILQEYIQKRGLLLPRFNFDNEDGQFVAKSVINLGDRLINVHSDTHTTKKAAIQNACKKALEVMKNKEDTNNVIKAQQKREESGEIDESNKVVLAKIAVTASHKKTDNEETRVVIVRFDNEKALQIESDEQFDNVHPLLSNALSPDWYISDGPPELDSIISLAPNEHFSEQRFNVNETVFSIYVSTYILVDVETSRDCKSFSCLTSRQTSHNFVLFSRENPSLLDDPYEYLHILFETTIEIIDQGHDVLTTISIYASRLPRSCNIIILSKSKIFQQLADQLNHDRKSGFNVKCVDSYTQI